MPKKFNESSIKKKMAMTGASAVVISSLAIGNIAYADDSNEEVKKAVEAKEVVLEVGNDNIKTQDKSINIELKKPGQDKPNQGKPEDKPNQDKPNQGKPEDKPNQDKPNQGKPEDKPNQDKPNQGKPEDKPNQDKPNQGKPEDKPNQDKPNQGKPEDKPNQDKPGNGNDGCQIGLGGHQNSNEHKITGMTKQEWEQYLSSKGLVGKQMSNNEGSNGWITYHIYDASGKQIEVVHIKFKSNSEEEGKPGDPSEPGESEKPGGSEDSEEPDKPGESEKPGGSEDSEEPDKPGESEKPGGSEDSDKPSKPEKPGKPGDSDKPSKPEKPGKPGDSEKPSKPEKPGKPGDSEKPSNSNKPQNPSNNTTQPNGNPKTGDIGILGYAGLGISSIVGLFINRKNNRK